MRPVWRDVREHLEGQDDPDLADVLALLTPRDRDAVGLSAFARMLADARPSFHADASCVEHPEISWFKTADEAEAIAICGRCLVKQECLDTAVANGEQGVWGGTVDRERAAMRRDAAA